MMEGTNMRKIRKKMRRKLLTLLIFLFGICMIYPLIWMFFASFKTNNEIYTGTRLLPETFDFSGIIKGWKSTGQYTYTDYFINTFIMIIPTVILTIISSTLIAYGFARFKFKGRNILFKIMLSTLMVPSSVLIIPRYLLYRDLNWLNTYMPFWATAALGCNSFFIYQEVQFMRGIPTDLDEAAKIDGCGSFRILLLILAPILKPSLMSVCIFQTIWTWNDFMNPLIYINSVSKYPISLALRLGLDVASTAEWNQIMAMAFISIIPLVILFFALQKYFVEGVATSGLKG